MPLILGTNSIKDTGYNVANSCRFNHASSDFLDRTPGSASNRRTFTFSCWVKRSVLNIRNLFSAVGTDAARPDEIRFSADHRLYVSFRNTEDGIVSTARLFRDVSAWMHILVAVDTTQSTASNRVKIFINGTQETVLTGDGAGDSASYPTENFESLGFNQASNHQIGSRAVSTPTLYFDGYMSEVCFIDGQALTPTSFGEFDSDSPTIWKPIDVSGLTFGTNGFYLDFEDSSALGNDVSGNNNDFTANNLTAVDQSTDTCTNNFATLNPLIEFYPSYTSTFSEGNLDITRSDNGGGLATIMPTQGKWYVEFKFITVGSGTNAIGVLPYDKITDNEFNVENKGVAYLSNGQKKVDGSASSYGNSYTANDIISIAINLDDGEAIFYKNGTAQNSGTAITGFTNDGAMAISCKGGGSTWKWSANFGSPSFSISSGNSDGNGYGNFEYAVPSGYYALNTKNLAEYG